MPTCPIPDDAAQLASFETGRAEPGDEPYNRRGRAAQGAKSTGHRPPAALAASSAVLPDPAGAHTKISRQASPSSSRPASRGRGTKPGGRRGASSLAASSTPPSPAGPGPVIA